ncbi:MAG: DUF21 domain-containing protein [Desulfobulbaceae bacterium]|nr:DUF21 domain-containing protein [Desulfobulbaceae bacterium]
MLIWVGILFCVSQSACFSGLNLAVFSVSRLRLEVESASGNKDAAKVIQLRQDSNFLLTTILWGNVGINVLLTLLSNSVLTGVSAFIFSTFVITFLGEIFPQAYFSRNALRMASILSPVLRFYQIVLYPLAKPSALILDYFLGDEIVSYLKEKDMRHLIRKHIVADEADIDKLEGIGALNFLAIDDLRVSKIGAVIDPESIIPLPCVAGRLEFPQFTREALDPFLQQVQKSGKKWVIITNLENRPLYALDADRFLREALMGNDSFNPLSCCHRPIVVTDSGFSLGKVISRLRVWPEHSEDDVIDEDIILVWTEQKQIITGADLLGRLMRGIALRKAEA